MSPVLLILAAAAAASIAHAAWSEIVARRRKWLDGMPAMPGTPSRSLGDSCGFGALAAIAFLSNPAVGYSSSPRATAMAAAAGMACLGALQLLSWADVRRRKRRLARAVHEVVRDDVGLRTSLQAPALLRIGRRNWTTHRLGLDGRIDPIRDALVPLVEDAIRGLPIELGVLVHPLPQSATLRAAMAAGGRDPMAAA